MTAAERAHEIARCNQEIAAMENQPAGQPAYLTTLGIEDWRAERRILEQMTTDEEGAVMIRASFEHMTEGEAQHVMQTLDGLISAVRVGHVHIAIGPNRTIKQEQDDREAMYSRLEQLTRPAPPAESTESYEAAAAVFEMRAAQRPCFVCGGFGWCRHREPQVAEAELQAATSQHDKEGL